MVCQTLKEGVECIFMKKTGCSYNGGRCYPIIDKCEGCSRIEEFPTGRFCSVYAEPSIKWKNGVCNFATHIKKESASSKKVINALKASKRKAMGRI